MRLNPIAVLKEKESPVGLEAGQDPLPVVKGPLEPLHKLWSVTGAWPLAVGLWKMRPMDCEYQGLAM